MKVTIAYRNQDISPSIITKASSVVFDREGGFWTVVASDKTLFASRDDVLYLLKEAE